MRPERKYYGKTIKSGVFLCSYKILSPKNIFSLFMLIEGFVFEISCLCAATDQDDC